MCAVVRSPRLCLLAVLLTFTAAARAQTAWTVNTNTDNGATTLETGGGFGPGTGSGNSGDLRYVLFGAMAQGGTNTVTFACGSPCQITLSAPLPPIFETSGINSFSLTIDGGSPGNVILDGASAYRVFFIDNVAVTLKNLVIQNATAQGGNGGSSGSGGGGGGAGFGAALFVNAATASVVVANTTFLNCNAIGGNGGSISAGGGDFGAGGGGLAFAGGSVNSLMSNLGGGGGGVSTASDASGDGGYGGGGGSGGNSSGGLGGAGYAANAAGTNAYYDSSFGDYGGGNGGFGGGGGGAAENAGYGGFGGGGGGSTVSINRSSGQGGFGGGQGSSAGGGLNPVVGGVQGGYSESGGAGGAAAGPAIFVVNGSVTLYNSTGSNFSATAGTGGLDATASAVPVFNYGGTVNGSTTVGPIANAFTVTSPVGTASPTQTATLTFAAAGTASAINVLTQGAPNLDFAYAAGGTCDTVTAHSIGDTCTVEYTVTPTHPGSRYGAITLTSGSTILASTLMSAIGTGPQIVYPSNTTATTLGGGFSYPFGVAVDATGNVYVADSYNSLVKEMTPDCPAASTVCVTTLGAGFYFPGGVAVDGAGNVYVADSTHNAIKEMTPNCAAGSTACITTLGGGFNTPYNLALDGAGNVYVADTNNNVIKEMTPNCTAGSTACVTTLGAGFSNPIGIAVDGVGNVYVADSSNNAIKEMTPNCTAGSTACVTTLGGGFSDPYGVGVDGAGNVYVGDSSNNAVKLMTPNCPSGSTACVTSLGGGFNSPQGIAIDGAGNVYVADTGNTAIKQIPLAAAPSLTFATPTPVGTTDTADTAQVASVFNDGNQPLIFVSPTPDASTGFSLGNESTACDQLASAALAAGTSCTLIASFAPTSNQLGPVSGSITLTDNALNAVNATQAIPLSGTAIIVPPQVITRFADFSGNTIATLPEGGSTNFLVYIANPNDTALSNITVNVQISSGLAFVSGTGGSCGGTTSASGNTITLTGVALSANDACQNGIELTATGPFQQSATSTPTTGTLTGTAQTVDIEVTQVVSATLSTVAASAPYAPFTYGDNITATVLDTYGNPVPGVSVTFSAGSSTTATFTSATLTASNGQTMVTVTDTAPEALTISANAGGTPVTQTVSLEETAHVWAASGNGGGFTRLGEIYIYTGGLSAYGTQALAIDSVGDPWVTFPDYSGLVAYLPNIDGVIQTSIDPTALNSPDSIAFDGAGKIWVTNSGSSSLSSFTYQGLNYVTVVGDTNLNTAGSSGLTLDISGNVWVANPGNNTVTEVLGAATPVLPLAASLATGTAAAKP